MLIVKESILCYFRGQACEMCDDRPMAQAEPHHIKPKGADGGSRLDVALNLISLCRECHNKVHDGGRKAQVECWKIVAKREGLSSWKVAEGAIHRLLRTKK